jgi:outer membrane protein insertion porin family
LKVCIAAIVAFLVATPSAADIRDLLGRTILDVRVEVAGVPYTDSSVLQLFETRIGEPLSMERVRESIDHLVGLRRFEDIRVFANSWGARGEGVAVRWVLVPVQRFGSIAIDTGGALSEGAVRAGIAERVGALPLVSRLPDIAAFVRSYYVDRGYRQAQVETVLTPTQSPELVALRLLVHAGPRSTVRTVIVDGEAGKPAEAVIADLGLARGRPFDASSVQTRATALEDELSRQGYYEADVEVSPVFNDAEPSVDVTVRVERGRHVRVVFAGDPLPENRRSTLVPIEQERSVDLDLLEDASRNIETFLRQDGYRAAEASYIREDRGGELVLTFTVKRGALHRLASIDVAGNSAVTRDEIAPLLVLKPGEPFSDARVATVASAVIELYRVSGFANVVVKPEVTVIAPESREGQQVRPVTVRLLITEGTQTTVGDVTISGAAAFTESRLLSLVRLTPGRPYYRPQLDADRDAIERAYRAEGFQSVRVDSRTSVRDDGARLDVEWTIVEGPRVVVDRVLVSGNVRTSADLIRREAVLKPGTPVSDDAVVESQRRLASLGLFRRVRIIELPHGASLTRDILIDVEEAPPTTIGYGGGLEAGRVVLTGEDSQAEDRIIVAPRGFFEISRRNLWGKNRSATLFTRVSLRPRDRGQSLDDQTVTSLYGFNDYRVVATFREPRPFAAPGDFQGTGFIEQAVRSSFNFRRSGFRVEYGRRLPNNIGLTGRYSLDRTQLFDVRTILPEDEVSIERLFPRVRLSMLTGSVLRDTRNDPIDPSGGTLVGGDLSMAIRALGSQVGFIKGFAQGFVYRRLSPTVPLTIVGGARLGLAQGFQRALDDGTFVDDMPVSERFFAGGDTTVRGFVLDRLGTADTLNSLGFPTGGSGLVVVNGEVRGPYWKGLSGVAFLDAGNVFRRASDLSLAELRPAAGIGLRYRSPIGPLRFDVGFNLDPQILPTGERERRTVFHLSIGQAF